MAPKVWLVDVEVYSLSSYQMKHINESLIITLCLSKSASIASPSRLPVANICFLNLVVRRIFRTVAQTQKRCDDLKYFMDNAGKKVRYKVFNILNLVFRVFIFFLFYL